MQAEPKKTVRSMLLRRWLWTNLKRLCVGLVGFAGFVFALTQAIGPPWPTYPDIEASSLSSSDVLDTIFNITNRSIFFFVNDLAVSCNINLETDDDAVISGPGYLVTGQKSTLDPRSSSPYECPQILKNGGAGKITHARIRLKLDFSWSLYGLKTKTKSYIEEFSYAAKLSGSEVKWVKGKPII